jgi:hypothetical protein
MPLFNFRLKPLMEVTPWGTGDAQSLHWFGLTDGWYWLDVGEEELFRYTPQLIQHLKRSDNFPYVDDQIVRLWENVIGLLPTILEPLPLSLLHKINVYESWFHWIEKAQQWIDATEDQQLIDVYTDALDWWGARQLWTGHLINGPRIALWSDGPLIHLEWDHRGFDWDGMQTWTAQTGKFSLSLNDFLEEVRSFNMRLIQSMGERVQEIKREWPRPNVFINIDQLEKEQIDRANQLQKSLSAASRHKPTNWERVLTAAAWIESAPNFPND